jgi:hypothetical protein
MTKRNQVDSVRKVHRATLNAGDAASDRQTQVRRKIGGGTTSKNPVGKGRGPRGGPNKVR